MATQQPVQQSLFDAPASEARPSFDRAFSTLERIHLDEQAWLDVAKGWVTGADALFEQVLKARTWGQRTRWIYEKKMLEPRLTSTWDLQSGAPLEPPLVEEMRQALSAHYGIKFDSAGFNLYRDGSDSVAWHRDRILKQVHNPIVVLVSLGAERRFLMRPYGGGKSHPFMLGHGDLLVTGGTAQRTWEHAVPKVAQAPGPRISIAFRYGLNPNQYADQEPVEPTAER